MRRQKLLSEKISEREFHPEVYVYPTPRMYELLDDFSLDEVVFSQDVNVYVHIPFCKQICSYCGYTKIIDSKGNMQDEYVTVLAKEIEMFKDVLKDKTVRTLHFGGGTPSLLTPSQLQKLIETLQKVNPNILKTSKEASIEATPESIEYTKFSEYKNLGINRVSMGVQSLNNTEIALSRRKNTPNISAQAIETLQAVGISNIVIDLMIGIEGQTTTSFETTIKRLLEYRPETVELYALGLMPNTNLSVKTPTSLMSNKEIYECYDIGRSLFLREGYIQDCHNRYAIPDKGSFLQEDYIFEDMSLVGFGAGARTYAKNIHYRNNYYAKSNGKAITQYMKNIKSGKLAVASAVKLTPEEKMRQYAIYNIESLDKKEFQSKFRARFKEEFKPLYEELLSLGLAVEDESKITLTPKGLTFRDLIAKQMFSKEVTKAEMAYRPTGK